MTGENRDANALAELRRAEQALTEADALAKLALHNGAASRACYAAYHAASAMLLRLGHQPRTHRGVEALVGKHLVEPGLLAPEHLVRLSRLQQKRSVADYRAAEEVSAEQLAIVLVDAMSFLEAAREFLAGK